MAVSDSGALVIDAQAGSRKIGPATPSNVVYRTVWRGTNDYFRAMLHPLLTSHRALILEQCMILSGFQSEHAPEKVASLGEISIFLD